LRLSSDLRAEVIRRAKFRCEYCLIHEADGVFPHEVDHIVSRQHGGGDTPDNLAYACMVCNRYKGSNIASLSAAGELIPLFNPRKARWEKHFRLSGAFIEPLDLTGEVTVRVLRLNIADRVLRRTLLQRLRKYPQN
jgi:5-methylcytosine-specific restriction endonuclease McrA